MDSQICILLRLRRDLYKILFMYAMTMNLKSKIETY